MEPRISEYLYIHSGKLLILTMLTAFYLIDEQPLVLSLPEVAGNAMLLSTNLPVAKNLSSVNCKEGVMYLELPFLRRMLFVQ